MARVIRITSGLNVTGKVGVVLFMCCYCNGRSRWIADEFEYYAFEVPG